MIDEANIGLDEKSDATVIEPISNPHYEDRDTTNLLAPVATTAAMVKKMIFPENFSSVDMLIYNPPKAEEIYGNELKKLESLQKSQYQ